MTNMEIAKLIFDNDLPREAIAFSSNGRFVTFYFASTDKQVHLGLSESQLQALHMCDMLHSERTELRLA